MSNVIHNIEYLLKYKNMSWYRLSKITGIPESSLRDYRCQRKRDITLGVAVKIAEALEVTLDELTRNDIKDTKK